MSKKLAFLVCASFYSTSAFALCDPKDFLKPDTEISDSASSVKWSYLSDMSKERFEEAKKTGHLFLSLPKVPLLTNIDYVDYKRLAQAEKATQKQYLSQVQTQTIYRSYLSPEGSKAYMACVQNEADHLDATVPSTAMEQSEFFVTLTWMGQRGVPMGKFDNVGAHHFQVFGGEIPEQADYDKIEGLQNGRSIRVRVKRDLAVPFGFAASVEGNSSEIGLPAKVEVKPLVIEVVTSPEQTAYGDGNADQHNAFCLTANANEIFLPSTVQFAERKILPSSTRAWTSLNQPVSEKSICATAHAITDNPKRVAKIWSAIKVVKITEPVK